MLASGRAARFVGPWLVGVVGQQGAAVPAQRLSGEGLVLALQGPPGGSAELADVDLDVVAAGEEEDQLLAQDEGPAVAQGTPGVVRRLVETGPGGVPRQARPQGVDHLLAVQPAVAAQGEELHELGGLAACPGVGRDGHAVADDVEAAEKPHLNAHSGTPGSLAAPSRGGCDATNADPMLSGEITAVPPQSSPGRGGR